REPGGAWGGVPRGLALLALARPDDALAVLARAIGLFERLALRADAASVLNESGACLFRLGRFAEARRRYTRALRHLSREPNARLLAAARAGLAAVLSASGPGPRPASSSSSWRSRRSGRRPGRRRAPGRLMRLGRPRTGRRPHRDLGRLARLLPLLPRDRAQVVRVELVQDLGRRGRRRLGPDREDLALGERIGPALDGREHDAPAGDLRRRLQPHDAAALQLHDGLRIVRGGKEQDDRERQSETAEEDHDWNEDTLSPRKKPEAKAILRVRVGIAARARPSGRNQREPEIGLSRSRRAAGKIE